MINKNDTNVSLPSSAMPSDFIENQYLDLYLKQSVRSHAGLILCAIAMYMILISKIDGKFPHLFLFIAIAINLFRIFFTNTIVAKSTTKVTTISKMHFLHGIVHALPLLGFSYLDDIEKSILTIIILTVSTVSVSTTNGYKYRYLWFISPLIISLCFAWVFLSNTVSNFWGNYILAFLIFVYFLYLIGLGRDLFAIFDESCRIRFSESEKNLQLQHALDEAKNASMAKTRFLASASHDLRQPMHTIGVLLAALGMRSLDTRSREIVDVLNTVNNSLASQLDGLLDISKLDAGVVQPDLKVYQLHELVKKHVSKISLTDQKQNLFVRVHATQEINVLTDCVLFERVLMNLTSNAIKFTEHGGLDISINVSNDKAILEVSDTGIGIASNMHQLVFQEFYQVSNPQRDRTAGLGLGLSIVKRICDLLMIQIQLISAPGQGSRFILSLPLAKVSDRLPNITHTPNEVQLHTLSVLVIDDEVDIRTGMRLLLEELGCNVVLADGIDQAVDAARKSKFDIVFSDYRLRGDENGIDAVIKVRSILPRVDAVLITGDTAPERLQNATNAGIQMLHKPVSFDAIVHQLQKTVAKNKN